MRLCSALFFATLLLTVCFGCRSYRRPIGAPGTLQAQRLDAVIHDPYADDEAGPPIVGGRPREYQQPISEASRSQLIWNRWWGQ